MNLGEKIIVSVIEIARDSNISRPKSLKLFKLIETFLPPNGDPNELDLMTICKLEVLLDRKLLYIPTKQQWRKIKLEKLNEICNKK